MSLGLDLSDLPAGVVYYKRDAWGLTWEEARRRGLSLQPGNLPEVYIHHTAGQSPDVNAAVWDDDPIVLVQWLDGYARNTKGYKALDYSVIIHQAPSGIVSIVEGRAEFYPAATLDRNTISKAICYAGNYHSTAGPSVKRPPSGLEIAAGRWLIQALKRAGTLARDVVGRGHSQNPAHPGATGCPGDWLLPYVPLMMIPWPPRPTTAPEEETMQLIRVPDDEAVLVRTGHLVSWVHGHDAGSAIAEAVRLGLIEAEPDPVPRSFLRLLTLVGPAPVYGSPPADRPGRTHVNDFSAVIA